jgi:hypothetical protein
MDEEKLIELYHRVFNTDDGRLVIQDLKNRSFAYISTVPLEGQVDMARVVFNEGKRSVVLHIETFTKPKEAQPKEEGTDNV